METPVIEYRVTFDKDHLLRKVTSILNTLGLGEMGYYKIGYKNNGDAAPLQDFDGQYKRLTDLIGELGSLDVHQDKILISPNPVRYLEVETKDRSSIIIMIKGNLEKPFFYEGVLYVRRGMDQTVALRSQREILEFIAKQEARELLSSGELKDWLDFCDAIIKYSTSSDFNAAASAYRYPNLRFVSKEHVDVAKRFSDFVNKIEWFSDGRTDVAAKRALSKMIRATEMCVSGSRTGSCPGTMIYAWCRVAKGQYTFLDGDEMHAFLELVNQVLHS